MQHYFYPQTERFPLSPGLQETCPRWGRTATPAPYLLPAYYILYDLLIIITSGTKLLPHLAATQPSVSPALSLSLLVFIPLSLSLIKQQIKPKTPPTDKLTNRPTNQPNNRPTKPHNQPTNNHQVGSTKHVKHFLPWGWDEVWSISSISDLRRQKRIRARNLYDTSQRHLWTVILTIPLPPAILKCHPTGSEPVAQLSRIYLSVYLPLAPFSSLLSQ